MLIKIVFLRLGDLGVRFVTTILDMGIVEQVGDAIASLAVSKMQAVLPL